LSIGIDLFKQAVEFASRTAPKLESGPNGADPFSHIDITLPLFTRETAVTDTYREQPRFSPYRPQRQLYTPPISKPAGMLITAPSCVNQIDWVRLRSGTADAGMKANAVPRFRDAGAERPFFAISIRSRARVFPGTAKMPSHNCIF
jgi:hypothetical protein